ncbi:MAG: hypothetical protein QOH21_880 [Acidobacteriota bacterium]|jgi:hypothetical protein|nr:hypothetical protein [Acidobacteriota bacterium]
MRSILACLTFAFLLPSSLLAADRPTYQAVRATTAPVIDGNLDETVWQAAPEITGFTQRDPDEGKPATQQTRLKVLYDDEAIYFGAFMQDDGKPTPLLARRDTDLNASDYIRISIDSQHDRLNGAAFVVNASNVQMDMTLYNDTYDDSTWDAVWESAAKIVPGGWIAEVRIPYSQLRFPARDTHVWGFNVSRRVARLNENSRLVFTPKDVSAFVSHFADLTGIEHIAPPRGFEIVPYGVARTDLRGRNDNPFVPASDYRMDGGVDVKYGISSSLTLTGTINPDFGQVEVDPAVLNLTQFETFFPEKRPFFTEGAQVFNFGSGPSNSRWGFNTSSPTYFYSRRIGRSPQGSIDSDWMDAPGETTILGAAKVTGKVGKGWTVGLLDALTDREVAWFRDGGTVGKQLVEPMTNYLVGRASKEYGKDGRSRIGFMFTSTNRRLSEELAPSLRESAYFAGVDGYTHFRNKTWLLEWQGGTSMVDGSQEAIALTQRSGVHYYQRPDTDHVSYDPTRTSLSGWSGRAMLNKQSGRWRPNLQVQAYSPGFEVNDLGFQTRTDAIASHAVLNYVNTDKTSRTREINVWAGKYQNWNFGRDLTANGFMANGFVEWTSYWYNYAWTGTNGRVLDDRRTRGGPAVLRPVSRWVGGGGGSDSRKRVSFELEGESWAASDDSRTQYLLLTARYRPTAALSLRFTPQWNYNLDQTQYVTTRVDPSNTATYGRQYIFATIEQKSLDLGIRADWTVSPRLSFQLFVQPFIASGAYSDFKQLARPRDDQYTPYESVQLERETNSYVVRAAGSQQTFGNPDFNLRSVRGSAVVRWEFRPGSALYVVWNENREDVIPLGDFRPRRDFAALPNAPSQDVFLVKFSYWLPM